MQRPRPSLLEPRWSLLWRDLLDARGQFLETQSPVWGVNMRQFRLVEPVQIKPRIDGLWPGARCAQAAFQAAPTGSFWDFPPFEPRWRAGTLPPPRLRAVPAISMATATSGLGVGGSRDILWRVLGWRIAASIVWSVVLLPVCTTVFIIFSSIDLFHPIQWLSNSFSDLYSSYVIFYLLLLSVIIIIISIFNVEFYTVVPSIPCSRLALIGKILHPQQLLHSFVHAAMGMMMAWCAAVMTKGQYSFLAVPCTGAEGIDRPAVQTCLNEHHLFLLLAGAFMGYSYSLLYFVNNMNYLQFPIVQQYKFLRFRRSLLLIVKHSCMESLYLVRNFCIVYYFLGYIPKAWIRTAMDLHTDEQFHRPLDTISGLLNLSLLYHVWLCGVFLLMTWYISWILFKIYSTEAHVFPVQPPFAEESNECLPRVLNSNPPLIIKYLALQDLMLLSQYSSSRRQEVFSLSQPEKTPDTSSPFGTPFGSSVVKRVAGIFDGNTCYGLSKSPQLIRRGPRLWTSVSGQQMSEFSNHSPYTSLNNAEGKTVRQPSVIYSWIQNKREQIKNFLSKRVLIMYFFSKHPEASIQAVFSDAQMHIWALEGLSHLVAASFTEDRFGVVQTTLPAILNTLLTLQEAVDKYFKLPHASSKPPRISGSLVDTSYKTLRFAFRASLKTAIYRITTTFGEHLNAVQASAEHQKRLQQFLEFKE
ncbi:nucleoporin NDC1 isoform X2 [Heterocephalus glaber]|uniref:Nucleoporin NDC1 n=1 Tax=Heterocephalus glaber TaxID=10181 RepID=A0AAX6SIG5_HETGA|nr:nucleoporin NDC1 isoform X2 [Heterocephalus glaber]